MISLLAIAALVSAICALAYRVARLTRQLRIAAAEAARWRRLAELMGEALRVDAELQRLELAARPGGDVIPFRRITTH